MKVREPWTEEEERDLIALYFEGFSYDEIAERLNRSSKAVEQKRYWLESRGVAMPRRTILRRTRFQRHNDLIRQLEEHAEVAGEDGVALR